MREEGGEFFLEVVGLSGILVDVILDGDLNGGRSTRYMSFNCCTRSMLYVSTNYNCIYNYITLCAKLAGSTGPSWKDSEEPCPDPLPWPPRAGAFTGYFSFSAFLKMELNMRINISLWAATSHLLDYRS